MVLSRNLCGTGILLVGGLVAVLNGCNNRTPEEFIVHADLNGDGKEDIISFPLKHDGIYVALNNGDLFAVAQRILILYKNVYSLDVDDFNNDGIPDLSSRFYCTNYLGRALCSYTSIALGNGNGTFLEYEPLPIDTKCYEMCQSVQ